MAVALSLGAASPSSAVPLTLDVWESFSFLGPGGISNFDYSSPIPVQIVVVDCCVVGDEYSVSLDGGPGVPTSDASLNEGMATTGLDPVSALANPFLSRLIVLGPAGSHTIDVTRTHIAFGFLEEEGSGFIRITDDVPEPFSLLLLGGGLAAFAFMRRRRAGVAQARRSEPERR